MKIIGIVSSGYGAKVLAEVSREEVEKVMNKYCDRVEAAAAHLPADQLAKFKREVAAHREFM